MNKSGIYLHIPFCKTKCIYCDFYSVTKRDDSIDKFVDCIVKEIKLNKGRLNNTTYDTIFFGGGTPSVLSENQLDKILNALFNHYNIDQILILLPLNLNYPILYFLIEKQDVFYYFYNII